MRGVFFECAKCYGTNFDTNELHMKNMRMGKNKTVFSQKLQVLPSSMVKLNLELVQMMKKCVFWHKRTQ